MSQLKSQIKPFDISKWEVKEAWEEVRANKGAPGVDGQSIEDFEKNLQETCTRSGIGCRRARTFRPRCARWRSRSRTAVAAECSAFPLSPTGWPRPWWPGISMRRVEPVFHPDSYGYRPGRSALDAVGKCRERCWKRDWVVDLDIQKFFDSVPWDLLVKAVDAHTDAMWVMLYVRRWLAAPLHARWPCWSRGNAERPQGAPVSPVLANLFLHYAFDTWMAREFPTIWFERYADDAVLHCVTEAQAREVLAALSDRMVEVGLRLHPDKTRIVYCKDGNASGLLRARRRSRSSGTRSAPGRTGDRRGNLFLAFDPAISNDALNKISREVRSWHLHLRTDLTFNELARRVNPDRGGLDQLLRPLPALGAVSRS